MSASVRIPADVDREDRLVGQLTARQLLILAVTAAVVYLTWNAVGVLRLGGFLAVAVPIGLLGVALAFGRHDGISLDRLALAAGHQRLDARRADTRRGPRRPRRPARTPGTPAGHDGGGDIEAAHAPAGHRPAPGARPVLPRVPVRDVRSAWTGRDLGVIEVDPRHAGHTRGRSSFAAVVEVAPVNLALRGPSERDALLAGFGRWLHALTTPVQILTRTRPLELTTTVAQLHRRADGLPHPALTAAAHDHAAHLADLAAHADLLARRTYLVFTHSVPLPRHTNAGSIGSSHTDTAAATVGGSRPGQVAEERLRRRIADAQTLLGAAGIRLTPLDATEAAHVLHAASHPELDHPEFNHRELAYPEPDKVGPDRADPDRADVDHTTPSRTDPDRAGPARRRIPTRPRSPVVDEQLWWPDGGPALDGPILNAPAPGFDPDGSDNEGPDRGPEQRMLAWATAQGPATTDPGLRNPTNGSGGLDGPALRIWRDPGHDRDEAGDSVSTSVRWAA